jgi:hypothetical protein
MNLPSIAFKLAAGPMDYRIAALKPTQVPTEKYEIDASAVPMLYHAGKALVSNIDDSIFDGWYGWGFYVAFDPDYVRRWYGPVISRIRILPGARILVASTDPAQAPSGLFDTVAEFDAQTNTKNDEARTVEFRAIMAENPVQWIHAVDRFVIETGYDVVIFGDEQVVIKPTEHIKIEGEELAPNEV